MNDKNEPNAEEVVGYGNPPLASRFQPGKSGNPAGRPRGSGLLKEALRKAALEETGADYVSRKRKGTALEVLLQQQFSAAIAGHHKQAANILRLVRLLDDDQRAEQFPVYQGKNKKSRR
jgi:hypothetical protein